MQITYFLQFDMILQNYIFIINFKKRHVLICTLSTIVYYAPVFNHIQQVRVIAFGECG